MARRLLAIDLDGTLLLSDGRVDARDAGAIRAVAEAEVLVTIATGRLVSGALPVARALDLVAPLICADGGLVACARTGALIEQRAIPLPDAELVIEALRAHALTPFVFLHDAIHGDASGRDLGGYLASWAPEIVFHDDLLVAAAWRRDGEISLVLGIGGPERVRAAGKALGDGDGRGLGRRAPSGDPEPQMSSWDLATFGLGPGNPWALRVQAAGCSKGDALSRVAAREGVRQEDVAAIGDWYNDLSMFAWAGRSFAMGNAPESVCAAATDTLAAESGYGGGVAEAIRRWLDEG